MPAGMATREEVYEAPRCSAPKTAGGTPAAPGPAAVRLRGAAQRAGGPRRYRFHRAVRLFRPGGRGAGFLPGHPDPGRGQAGASVAGGQEHQYTELYHVCPGFPGPVGRRGKRVRHLPGSGGRDHDAGGLSPGPGHDPPGRHAGDGPPGLHRPDPGLPGAAGRRHPGGLSRCAGQGQHLLPAPRPGQRIRQPGHSLCGL